MRASINYKDELVLDAESPTEAYALRQWIEQNPAMREGDGIKITFNCLKPKEKENE